MKDLEALARLIQAIEPWRDNLVFIGGWAHRIHRYDNRANLPNYQPVFTRDTDLAFCSKIPMLGDIKSALYAQGFKEELSGDLKPPVAHYTLGNMAGFYAEFLTPLIGTGTKRGGVKDATLTMAGISAQKIRHLNLLLMSPWEIELGPRQNIPLPRQMCVRVANPLCFMIQKLLIKKNRLMAKEANDVLYIYDTFMLFGALQEEFRESWHKDIAPQLDEKTRLTVIREYKASFSAVTDIIRQAARIPQDRKLDAQEIQETCSYAFEMILES